MKRLLPRLSIFLLIFLLGHSTMATIRFIRHNAGGTNNVHFKGTNNVQLLPGFSVAPAGAAGTVFSAEISPSNN